MLRPASALVPFGANGIEVSRAGDRIFVANTGTGQLLSVQIEGTQEVRVLAAVRTADGLTQPTDGTVAVASSTGNNIVVVDANTGARRAVLGSATGPGALSMPASLVRSGNDLIVTNLGGRAPIVSRIPLPEALR
jgi:DNA-binding beta-propeller fold protein YncE